MLHLSISGVGRACRYAGEICSAAGSIRRSEGAACSQSSDHGSTLIESTNAPRSLTDFTVGRPLGKGKFGRVYLARMNAPPHYIVALKSLDKAEIIQGRVEKQVRREIEIQQNLRYVKAKLRCLHTSYMIDRYTDAVDIRTCCGCMATFTMQNESSSCSSLRCMVSCTSS